LDTTAATSEKVAGALIYAGKADAKTKSANEDERDGLRDATATTLETATTTSRQERLTGCQNQNHLDPNPDQDGAKLVTLRRRHDAGHNHYRPPQHHKRKRIRIQPDGLPDRNTDRPVKKERPTATTVEAAATATNASEEVIFGFFTHNIKSENFIRSRR
jgi:hypothetical protein